MTALAEAKTPTRAEAWVVRVADTGAPAPDNARSATVTLTQDPGGGTAILDVTAGRRIRGDSAENPGAWGNFLRADVDYGVATAFTRVSARMTASSSRT